MAKRTKKSTSRSLLKLEALEQRQLLASGFTEAQGQEFADIVHPNGNVYDQVLLKSSSITVMNDPGQITRVSFLDLSGDIVQAEFSGAGSLSISLDADTYQNNVAPENYNQSGVLYVQGLATFTVQGSDASTNFTVFSVGSTTAHAGVDSPLFADGKTGGNNFADVARLTIVADPSNPNGSVFGGIRAGNAIFSDDSGVVGITAANVHVQDVVRVGDIDATGTATPALTFGENSQFGSVEIAGGDLVQTNGKSVNNSGSYGYQITSIDNETSFGAELPAQTITSTTVTFTDDNPFEETSKTFNLTTAIDDLKGTSGNDTFNASHTKDTPVVATLDKVDGGAGTDTLSVADSTGDAPISGLSVTNVENFVYTSTGDLGGSSSLNTTAWTGLTNSTLVLQNIGTAAQTITAGAGTAVNVNANATGLVGTAADPGDPDGPDDDILTLGDNVPATPESAQNSGAVNITGGSTVTLSVTASGTTRYGTGGATVTGVDGTTSVNVTQTGKQGLGTLGAVNVNDVNADSGSKAGTITSVTLNGVDNASTIKSNALESLSLTKVTAGITVDDHIGTGNTDGTTLTLAVNETNTTLTDDNGSIKQLDVTATGKDSTVNFQHDGNNALTAINVAGDKKLTLTGTSSFGSNFATLTSTNTAGVVATVGDNVTVTTDAGADSITAAATKKAINVGAGNDTVAVTLTGEGTLGSGGSLEGGDGTDTVSLDIGAAVEATKSTTFADSISGFEALSLTGAGGGEVKLNNLDLIKSVTIASNLGTAVSLTGLDSGASLTYTATQDADTTVTVPISAIQNETLALKISANANLNVQNVDTGQISAVTIDSDDTNNDAANTHTIGLTSDSLRTITVSGDAGLVISTTGESVTSITATGLSKAGLTVTTGALENAATITTGSKDDSITATQAEKAVTVVTGDGVNSVTIENANANTITGGSGIDTITVGSGNNTITAGGGNDVVTLNQGGDVGANTVDLGDGNDDITIGKAKSQSTITLGGGADDVIFAANSVPTQEGYFLTFTGVANTDTFNFANIDLDTDNTVVNAAEDTTFNTTKVELGAGVAFSDYLDAAAAADNVTTTGSDVRWFQFGGDTFLVLDNSDNTTFTAGVDMVVRLSGNLTLAGSGGLASEMSTGGVLTI